MATFSELLGGIYCPAPETRERSVEAYRTMALNQPNELVSHLLETMSNEPNAQVREVAILMLRRAVIKHEESLWPQLTEESKTMVKAALLHGLHHETSDRMRKKLNDTVADLASHICANGEWPELLDDLFHLSSSEDNLHRESGLLIFGQLLNAPTLREMLAPHLQTLRDIVNNGMNDGSLSVRLSGLQATAGFILAARSMETKALLQPLVPSMIEVLKASIASKHSPSLSLSLEVFNDWALDPIFFEKEMNNLLTVMFQVCNTPDTPGHQQLAAEFLVALAARQPQYMSHVPHYVDSMIDMLLKRLMELDDMTIEEWNETSEDDMIEVSNADVFEDTMDSFCLAMGGRVVVPHIMGPIVQLISSNAQWTHRYAGLMATSLIAEGCKKALKSELTDLVGLVYTRLQDSHPRVRWAAVTALGQLSHDFAPYFQTEFHEAVMPSICAMFDDNENPKIQSITASCIISYSEKAPPETLLPYMDQILQRLHFLLGSQSKFVLEEGVSCIGALASCAKKHFTPYYDNFIPILKGILQNTHETQWYNLRAKTIDTFSIIGDAVGKDKFGPDAKEFMEALQQTHLGEFGKVDSMRENMLYAAARICKILQDEFIPYLPMIIPSLLETANMGEGHYLDVTEENDPSDSHNRAGWQYTIYGNRKFGIHESALQEKNVAVRMIFSFVDNLFEGIMPYIPEIVATITPLMTFPFHKGIRAAAATIAPLVLHVVKSHGEKTNDMTMFQELFNYFFDNLVQAINDEEFNNVLPAMLDALAELLEAYPEQSLSADFCRTILDTIEKTLIAMRSEMAERAALVESGDYTPDEEEEWEQIDKWQDNICTELADLYGVTVRTQPQVVLTLFQERVPFIMSLLPEESNLPCMIQVGLCMMDDSIEHLKDPMAPLLNNLVPYMIHYCAHESHSVRQAASYGLGTAAQNGGAEMADWLAESLDALINQIEAQGSRDEEPFQAPTENAICAVGKILLYQPIPEDQMGELISRWISWMPLYVDQLEARTCHSLLISFIEQSNPHIWGVEYSNLPKILDIISWCITEEGLLYITAELLTRMRNVLKTMNESAPELLQSAVGALSPNQQDAIANAINSPDH